MYRKDSNNLKKWTKIACTWNCMFGLSYCAMLTSFYLLFWQLVAQKCHEFIMFHSHCHGCLPQAAKHGRSILPLPFYGRASKGKGRLSDCLEQSPLRLLRLESRTPTSCILMKFKGFWNIVCVWLWLIVPEDKSAYHLQRDQPHFHSPTAIFSYPSHTIHFLIHLSEKSKIRKTSNFHV